MTRHLCFLLHTNFTLRRWTKLWNTPVRPLTRQGGGVFQSKHPSISIIHNFILTKILGIKLEYFNCWTTDISYRVTELIYAFNKISTQGGARRLKKQKRSKLVLSFPLDGPVTARKSQLRCPLFVHRASFNVTTWLAAHAWACMVHVCPLTWIADCTWGPKKKKKV